MSQVIQPDARQHPSTSRALNVDCTHCGLPVPAGLIDPDRQEQFCCNGCSTAWRLICDNGLDDFYRMADSSSDSQSLQRRSAAADAKFTGFDDEAFLEKFASTDQSGCRTIELSLDGIHCAACVWLIEKLPNIVAGVRHASVNWSRQTVRVAWDPGRTTLSIIGLALYRLGYQPHPIRTNEKANRRQAENRQHLVRIGIAAAAAGNNMLIAASLYLGMFSYMSGSIETLLRIASCLVGLLSLFWPGRIFIQGAISALRTRTPHMDLPIALALVVGTAAGLVNTIRGAGEIYFDSLSVLIFLLLVGRWIQFHQQNRAADAVELLYRLTPQRARKIIDGETVEVSIEHIEKGDLVEIRPGDLIPADAMIVEGQSLVDQSILSGESRPVKKSVGDQLSAGTRNLNSLLIAKATCVGRETRINKIVELVEQAATDRPKVVQWANRIGGYFVVIVIGLAIATFLTWLLIDSNVATDRAVALLIVACPCALALATPLAISVALGRLAQRQIMVKAGDVMQNLSQPGVIWLDKTGTLTEGEMKLVRWHGDGKWKALVGAIESKFSHPIATAFSELNEPGLLNNSTIEETSLCPGGVFAKLDGAEIRIGNRTMIETQGIDIDRERIRIEEDLLNQGLSPCWVAIDAQVVAIAGLGDRIRPGSRDSIAQMKKIGWKIGILSGDHPEVVTVVARQLDIDDQLVIAGVSPEEKLQVIRESGQQYKTTVMVGDGVNDSAALAAATVGIAVHNGAEASLAAAPVYLGRAGLGPVLELIRASNSTCRTIGCNFAASLAYNILGVGLAMAGMINPLVAAVLMPVSSLTVIAISLRSGRFDSKATSTHARSSINGLS